VCFGSNEIINSDKYSPAYLSSGPSLPRSFHPNGDER